MKTLIAVALLATSTLFAQTAKVVQLDAADAAEAKRLDEAQKKLDEAKAALSDRIQDKYLMQDAKRCFTVGPCRMTKEGWAYGFQYSEDFRFIVPAEYPKISTGSGSIMLTPSAWSDSHLTYETK